MCANRCLLVRMKYVCIENWNTEKHGQINKECITYKQTDARNRYIFTSLTKDFQSSKSKVEKQFWYQNWLHREFANQTIQHHTIHLYNHEILYGSRKYFIFYTHLGLCIFRCSDKHPVVMAAIALYACVYSCRWPCSTRYFREALLLQSYYIYYWHIKHAI